MSHRCESCAGTGEPSPWEYDRYVWLKGVAYAVCGACGGAGRVSRLFGLKIKPKLEHLFDEPERHIFEHRRDTIAKALYDDWVAEEQIDGNEYVCWKLLPDKETWRRRAVVVINAEDGRNHQ